jgi:hypothetical protein
MRAWLTEHPQFNGREARPLRENSYCSSYVSLTPAPAQCAGAGIYQVALRLLRM